MRSQLRRETDESRDGGGHWRAEANVLSPLCGTPAPSSTMDWNHERGSARCMTCSCRGRSK